MIEQAFAGDEVSLVDVVSVVRVHAAAHLVIADSSLEVPQDSGGGLTGSAHAGSFHTSRAIRAKQRQVTVIKTAQPHCPLLALMMASIAASSA
jgi:hypothetical protein